MVSQEYPEKVSKMEVGRSFEYLTARLLWEQFKIVTFPAPVISYDLLTLGGLRIEVKGSNSQPTNPSLKNLLKKHPLADFFVIWQPDFAAVLSRTEVETHLERRKRDKGCIRYRRFQDCWEGIQVAEKWALRYTEP